MSGREMVYPYTLTAKVRWFPFKYYYNNNPYFKCWVWAMFISFPIFYKIERLVKSPGNYANLEAYYKKQEAEHEKHLEHLL